MCIYSKAPKLERLSPYPQTSTIPVSRGQNLALTALCVPNSLDSGLCRANSAVVGTFCPQSSKNIISQNLNEYVVLKSRSSHPQTSNLDSQQLRETSAALVANLSFALCLSPLSLSRTLSRSLSLYIYIYMYIYTYVYICMYIHIHGRTFPN